MYNNKYFKEIAGKEYPDFDDIIDGPTRSIIELVLEEYHCKYEHIITKYKDQNFVMARCMLVHFLDTVLLLDLKFIAKIMHMSSIESVRRKKKEFAKLMQVKHFSESRDKLQGYLTELYSMPIPVTTESESDRLRRLEYIRT